MYVSNKYLLTLITIVLLAIFPVAGGTNILQTQPLAEAISIILLVLLFLSLKRYDFILKSTWLFVLFILLTPLFYLIPLPFEVWNHLPGHEIYSQIAQWINTDASPSVTKFSLSLIPYQTEFAFFSLLPPIAIFLTVASLPEQQKRWIIFALLGIATLEACLATIQFSTNNPFFYFGVHSPKAGIALGTYPNPDHFVLLMEITIPLIFALAAYEYRYKKERHDDGLHSLVLFIIYGTLLLLFLGGAFFSGSRAGIPLALLSSFLAYKVFSPKKGFRQFLPLAFLLALAFVVLLIFFNLAPVLNKFITSNPFVDGRWVIFSHTWEGIVTFFPVGSGPGTFPDIYRIFQPIQQTGFINHAHNDYLELLFETGLLGAIAIIGFIYLFIKAWNNMKKIKVREIHFLRIATGISIFVLLLHSTVEFNLHDASNILYFAVLTGIFFTPSKGSFSRSKHYYCDIPKR